MDFNLLVLFFIVNFGLFLIKNVIKTWSSCLITSYICSLLLIELSIEINNYVISYPNWYPMAFHKFDLVPCYMLDCCMYIGEERATIT